MTICQFFFFFKNTEITVCVRCVWQAALSYFAAGFVSVVAQTICVKLRFELV